MTERSGHVAERHPIGRCFQPGRAIGNGITAIRIAAGPLWLGGLLMAVSEQGCNVPTGLPDIPWGEDESTSAWRFPDLGAWRIAASPIAAVGGPLDVDGFVGWIVAFVAAIAFVAIAFVVALFSLKCWTQTGFIRLHANVLEHANDALAPLFSGKDRFRAMVGWKLLSGFTVSAAVIVAVCPGLLVAWVGYRDGSTTATIGGIGTALVLGLPTFVFVALGTYLGDCAVVLENASPVAALRRAWALARGNRFSLLWFAIVCMVVELLSVLGILLCCVGLFATVPLALALTGFAKTESFLLFTRGWETSAGWKLWHRHTGVVPVPPPQAPPPALPPES